MIEFALLAQQLTTFLAPFLPTLLKIGESTRDEVIKDSVKEGLDEAKQLWSKLHPKIQEKEAANEALHAVVADPEDTDALATLRFQIRKILEQDSPLADDLAKIVAPKQFPGITVTASGDRSVAIGGRVSGTTISTGEGRLPPRGTETEPSST